MSFLKLALGIGIGAAAASVGAYAAVNRALKQDEPKLMSPKERLIYIMSNYRGRHEIDSDKPKLPCTEWWVDARGGAHVLLQLIDATDGKIFHVQVDADDEGYSNKQSSRPIFYPFSKTLSTTPSPMNEIDWNTLEWLIEGHGVTEFYHSFALYDFYRQNKDAKDESVTQEDLDFDETKFVEDCISEYVKQTNRSEAGAKEIDWMKYYYENGVRNAVDAVRMWLDEDMKS